MARDRIIIVCADRRARTDMHMRLARRADTEVRSFEDMAEFHEELPHLDGGCLVKVETENEGTLPAAVRAITGTGAFRMIVVAETADVPCAVAALRAGADHFLMSPCDPGELAEAVEGSLERLRQLRERQDRLRAAMERIDRLTERERDVALLMAEGFQSKEIARSLDLSPRTVEVHRAKIMKRLEVRSLAELLRIVFLAQQQEPVEQGPHHASAQLPEPAPATRSARRARAAEWSAPEETRTPRARGSALL